VWEAHIKAKALLAKITPALIEDVKLRRAQDVARSTVDKDLAGLKAFFNFGASHVISQHPTPSAG
jgi:hypothetical protein